MRLADGRAHVSVAVAALCATLCTSWPPTAVFASGYLETDLREATAVRRAAITELSAATHAVVKAQTRETIDPFATSLIDIALNTDRKELARLVDLSLDAALSVPPA